MDNPITVLTRTREIMAYLSERHYLYIKKEVEEMTQEEAQRIWAAIEENWRYVALRAGNGRSNVRMQWTSLLRKMGLIENKAKGEN